MESLSPFRDEPVNIAQEARSESRVLQRLIHQKSPPPAAFAPPIRSRERAPSARAPASPRAGINTACPKSAMKPTAAETLSGMPVINNAKIHPREQMAYSARS